MGNSASLQEPIQLIDQLNLGPEEKRNLHIYLWRSQSETNQHIPKTFLNFPSVSQLKNQLFSCRVSNHDSVPNITFEKYVCDFRPLVGFLDLAQSLTLFQSVLKGHQSIYSKFYSTIIHEKCCFLTHDGQARIWINQNYCSNDLWTAQKKDCRLRTSSAHEMNCQTPRFMTKKQFDFQAITALTSEGVIIRKIIEWMPKFAKKSRQSMEFWAHLQKYIQGNMLANCSFNSVQRFIHMWAYQKKITLRTNIEDSVKELIKEGKILQKTETEIEKNIEKSSKNSKRRLSTIHTDRRKESPVDLNITIDRQSEGVSVFDIRNVESHHIYDDNQNLSQILGKSLNSGNISSRMIQKNNKSRVQKTTGEQRISIKEKQFSHRRKISKSFVHQKVQPMNETAPQIEQLQSARSVIYQNVDFWSVKSKETSLQESRSAKNKLNHSYQYSISLINSNINKVTQSQPGNAKKNIQVSTAVSEINKTYQFDEFRPRSSSKKGSILKKSQTKLLQTSKERISGGNEKEITSKKKNPVVFDTVKITIQHENQQIIHKKEPRFLTFGPQSNDDITTQKGSLLKNVENQISQNQNLLVFKPYQPKQTVGRTRQNSSIETHKVQKPELYPLKQITNYEISSKKPQPKVKMNNSDTSINPGSGSSFKGQASMMLNLKYLEDGIQDEIIRSKRRISVGGEGDLQRRFKMQKQDEYGMISIMNHPAEKTPKTINGLFSSQDKLETSFGSISSVSNEFNSEQNMAQKYSGILSKMGRSVQFRKIAESDLQKPSQFQIASSKNASEQMPNFTKKRTICDHGSKRSMRL